MTDAEIGAALRKELGWPESYVASLLSCTIFRAGMREAARIIEDNIDKYPRTSDLPGVRKMQEIARVLRAAAGEGEG